MIQAGLQAAAWQQAAIAPTPKFQCRSRLSVASVRVSGSNYRHRQPSLQSGRYWLRVGLRFGIAGSNRSQAIPRMKITTNDPKAKDKMTIVTRKRQTVEQRHRIERRGRQCKGQDDATRDAGATQFSKDRNRPSEQTGSNMPKAHARGSDRQVFEPKQPRVLAGPAVSERLPATSSPHNSDGAAEMPPPLSERSLPENSVVKHVISPNVLGQLGREPI